MSIVTATDLNEKFAQKLNVHFETNSSGQISCLIRHQDGATARVYLLGATVTHFSTSKGEQLIFLSQKAKLDGTAAIRGGIPICWPQFGKNGPLTQQHGFARNKVWSVDSSKATKDEVSVVFVLQDDEATRKIWDFGFKLLYTVTLKSHDLLECELSVHNTDPGKPFPFTTALHTYFSVPSAPNASVGPGFKGIEYIDKLREAKKFTEENDTFRYHPAGSEFDRVYLKAPDTVTIANENSDLKVRVSKQNLPELVLWNIGKEKISGMADLSSWEQYVCVEVALIDQPITLQPGKIYNANLQVQRI